jgi:hypothetical protein
MTDPGALALIGTEYTSTTAARVIAIIPHELVALLPLPAGKGTNFDFDLDGHQIFVDLEGGRDAGGALDSRRCHCWGCSEVLIPLWLMTPSNSIVACFPTALGASLRPVGTQGMVSPGSLRKYCSSSRAM